MPKPTQTFFSPTELGSQTGTSRRFILAQIELGRLRASRVSLRTILIHQKDIDEWIESNLLPTK